MADNEEEQHSTAKSAEDRKTASALANLDHGDEASGASARNIDHDAVNKAIENISGAATKATSSSTKQASAAAAAPRKNVKVDAADVALLVDELDMTKPKATEFLKTHDGNAVAALRAYVSA